jgi:hypothetical protein
MTINRLLAEPERYANREVTLKGEVTRSASVLGKGGYELDDGTGRIWVVSRRGVPRKGARVESKGRVRDIVNAGDLIKLPKDVEREIGNGLVLVEGEHRAR